MRACDEHAHITHAHEQVVDVAGESICPHSSSGQTDYLYILGHFGTELGLSGFRISEGCT